LFAGRHERIAILELELRDQDRALQEKNSELQGKERELQARVGVLQEKECELITAQNCLKNAEAMFEVQERERRDLVADIQAVRDWLEVSEAATPARRLLLIPQRVKDVVMEQARRITQKVMGIVFAHYPSFDGEAVGAGWPLDLPDAACDAAEARAADLAEKMTTLAAEELGIIEAPEEGVVAEDPSVPAS